MPTSWVSDARMETSPNFAGRPAFEVIALARHELPVVLSSPHSGCCYPDDFLAASRLDRQTIRGSEDTHVDALMLEAVALGAPLLKANFPRAWLDVNREPYELDPKMFAGSLPTYANIRSVRVAGGLGTIARVVSEREEIYASPLAVEAALARIDLVYKPFHRLLRQLVVDTRATFGVALLIDCHSMPSNGRGGHARLRPDIVIGDRYGTSCVPELTDLSAQILARRGYSVSRNKPYAGGFITEHYGQPGRGMHALQIEVNRSLYMDERTLEKHSRFAHISADLAHLVGELGRAIEAGFLSRPEAAE
jgi:N-formylglutamate amidohydrolase